MKFEFQKLNYNIKNFIHNELVKLSQYFKPAKEPPKPTKSDKEGLIKIYNIITSTPNNRKNSRKLINYKLESACSPIKAKDIDASKSAETAPKRVKVKIRVRTGTIPRLEDEHIELIKYGNATKAIVNKGKKDEKNTIRNCTHDNIADISARKNMSANNYVTSTNFTKDLIEYKMLNVNMVEHGRNMISNFKYKLKLSLHNEVAKLSQCIKTTIETCSKYIIQHHCGYGS
jgi:hypothetical protein